MRLASWSCSAARFLAFAHLRPIEYSVLFSNLAPDDASAVITKLDSQKIPHQISADGTTVYVPADVVADERVAACGRRYRQGWRHRLRTVRPHESRHDRHPRADREDSRDRRRVAAHHRRSDAGGFGARSPRGAGCIALFVRSGTDDRLGRGPHEAGRDPLAARSSRHHATRCRCGRRTAAGQRHDRQPGRHDPRAGAVDHECGRHGERRCAEDDRRSARRQTALRNEPAREHSRVARCGDRPQALGRARRDRYELRRRADRDRIVCARGHGPLDADRARGLPRHRYRTATADRRARDDHERDPDLSGRPESRQQPIYEVEVDHQLRNHQVDLEAHRRAG